MNLQEAKQLLKKKGFTVIKENNSLTYTAQDIFEEMYDRRYQYFEDTDSTYTSLNEWFVHGYNNDISMEELGKQAVESDGESSIADDQLAYEEGAEFSKCQTDDEVQDLLAEYTNDQYWN